MLRTIDGNPVKLVANDAVIGLDELYYDVVFEDVVYDLQVTAEPLVDGFRFLAPTTAATIDLATVARLPLPKAGRR